MPSICRQPIFGALRDQASDVILTGIPEQRSAKTRDRRTSEALTPHKYQKSQSILVRISQIHRSLTGTDLFPTNFSGGKYR